MELLDSSSDVLPVIVNRKRAFCCHFQTIHHLFEASIVHESKIAFGRKMLNYICYPILID